jgi:hypothetical protein
MRNRGEDNGVHTVQFLDASSLLQEIVVLTDDLRNGVTVM